MAENIRVTFCNGVNADAEIKKYDKNTDLAVLAVIFGVGIVIAVVNDSNYFSRKIDKNSTRVFARVDCATL